MRVRPVTGCFLIAGALAILATLGCRREVPPPAPVLAPAPALDPWSFHFVGGLLVITGELDEPVVVTLKGTTLNETRSLSYGPVRWELVRPPAGEVAELRTAEGKLLVKFDFNLPPPPRERPPVPLSIPQAVPSRPGPPQPPPRPVPQAMVPRSPSHSPLWGPAVPPPPVRPLPTPVPPPRPGPAAAMPVRPLPAQPQRPPVPPQAQPVPPPNPRVPPRVPGPPSVPPVKPPASAVPAPVPPAVHPPLPPIAHAPVPSSGEWPGAGEGSTILRGPRGGRRICLSFDGGSTCEVAGDVLDALKARGIRTTIFLTGEFIRKYPDLVRRMAREGHELGNHTLTHPHLAPSMRRDPRWTRERFQEELLDADRVLYRLLGRPFDPYWRAPFGEQTPELRKWAEELGYRHVGWSEGADTLDWATTRERKLYRTGNAILDKLKARMEKQDGDGLIVLMHLGSGRPDGDRPGQVLGPFLDRAIQDGWHFVSVGEYLQGLGKPRWEPARRVGLLR